MRKFNFIATVIIALVIVSCAKYPGNDDDQRRTASLKAWMELNEPTAIKDPSGIYMIKLDSLPKGESKKAGENDWVKINYTMRDLYTGTIFVTRDAVTAKQIGTYKSFAHYAPEFQRRSLISDGISSYMLPGIYHALANMREGEKWRLFVPSELAFSSSGSSSVYASMYGYGVSEVYQLRPYGAAIVDLELVEVIKDVESRNSIKVREYAQSKMLLGINDTTGAKDVYYRNLSYDIDTAYVRNVEDSIVKIRYVGTFLEDGFMFETNIADSARNRGQYRPSENYKPQYFSAQANDTLMIKYKENEQVMLPVKGLGYAMAKMRFGETGEVVMSSAQGFGDAIFYPIDEEENLVAGTIIPPYTPIKYIIQIAPLYGNGSWSDPYDPRGVSRDMGNRTGVWVRGYIAGAVDGTFDGGDLTESTTVDSNIVLSYRTYETSEENCCIIELPAGAIREALNLKDDTKRYNMKVAVFGDITPSYLGGAGVINVTKFVIDPQ